MAKVIFKSVVVPFSYNERGRCVSPIYIYDVPPLYQGFSCTYGSPCPFPARMCKFCRYCIF